MSEVDIEVANGVTLDPEAWSYIDREVIPRVKKLLTDGERLAGKDYSIGVVVATEDGDDSATLRVFETGDDDD